MPSGEEEKDSIVQHFQLNTKKALNMILPSKGLLVSFPDIPLISIKRKMGCVAGSTKFG
jgi:hypothetical protein